MTNVRLTPQNTFSISNLSDPGKEQAAQRFDVGNKGYLTFSELAAWFASENNDRMPNVQELAAFLGTPQHPINVEHLNGYEALQSQFLASTWKGDFNIPGLKGDNGYVPAGNVRIGREIGPQYTGNNQRINVDQVVFLADLNLMNRSDFDSRVTGATLVVGPKGFKPEQGSRYGEAVEISMTLYSEPSRPVYSRFGSTGQSTQEKKLLTAQVETAGLRDLAKATGGELSFYVRLDTRDGGSAFINKDGKAFANFDLSAQDLASQGQP